jgi:hypothetical protein
MISDERLQLEIECSGPMENETWEEKDRIMFLIATELKSRRESDLRVATKFLTNSYYKQIGHIESEFDEVRMAVTNLMETVVLGDKPNYAEKLNHAAEELVDLQSTCETMLAILGLDEQQRRDVRKRVIAKNEARNYYEEATKCHLEK